MDQDQRDFAWLRQQAPSAGTIEAYDDVVSGSVVLRLEGATDEDLDRLRQGLALRAPWHIWDVRGA